jgi:hypothetical protein
MGKKTEEKMDAVKKALTLWKSTDVNYRAGVPRLQAAQAERDRAQKQFQDYYTKRHVGEAGGSGAGASREAGMNADATLDKLDDAARAASKKLEKLENAVRAVSGDLKRAKAAVVTTLADLEKFVNEKDMRVTDATKKKSIPAARAFIKEVRGLVG